MIESKRLIKHYSAMAYWLKGLKRITVCYRAEEAGIHYTDEERAELRKASDHLHKAKEIVSAIYSKRIGDAITMELRS